MSWQELIPDPQARQRLLVNALFGLLLLLAALAVACGPGWLARRRVHAAQRAVDAAVKLLETYARAHGGTPPGHVPMRRQARRSVSVAQAGGGELTTFDTSQIADTPADPLSAGDGTQPLIYFSAAGASGPHWLIASVGPDGVYQLRGHILSRFASQGAAALKSIMYDPTNGTRSVGDIIRTGP